MKSRIPCFAGIFSGCTWIATLSFYSHWSLSGGHSSTISVSILDEEMDSVTKSYTET